MDEPRFEFYVDDAMEHRWRAKDRQNGKILFVSGEGYKRKEDAVHCACRAGYTVCVHEAPDLE